MLSRGPIRRRSGAGHYLERVVELPEWYELVLNRLQVRGVSRLPEDAQRDCAEKRAERQSLPARVEDDANEQAAAQARCEMRSSGR